MAKKRGRGWDGGGTLRKGLKSDVTAGGGRLKKKCCIVYLERWNVGWNVVYDVTAHVTMLQIPDETFLKPAPSRWNSA